MTPTIPSTTTNTSDEHSDDSTGTADLDRAALRAAVTAEFDAAGLDYESDRIGAELLHRLVERLVAQGFSNDGAARIDEAEAQLAYLADNCANLTREQLVQKISERGPERHRAVHWLSEYRCLAQAQALTDAADDIRARGDIDQEEGPTVDSYLRTRARVITDQF